MGETPDDGPHDSHEPIDADQLRRAMMGHVYENPPIASPALKNPMLRHMLDVTTKRVAANLKTYEIFADRMMDQIKTDFAANATAAAAKYYPLLGPAWCVRLGATIQLSNWKEVTEKLREEIRSYHAAAGQKIDDEGVITNGELPPLLLTGGDLR